MSAAAGDRLDILINEDEHATRKVVSNGERARAPGSRELQADVMFRAGWNSIEFRASQEGAKKGGPSGALTVCGSVDEQPHSIAVSGVGINIS